MTLTVAGSCPRCEMLSIDQTTGIKAAKPSVLLELATYRRRQGKMHFGVLLSSAESVLPNSYNHARVIRRGDLVTVD